MNEPAVAGRLFTFIMNHASGHGRWTTRRFNVRRLWFSLSGGYAVYNRSSRPAIF